MLGLKLIHAGKRGPWRHCKTFVGNFINTLKPGPHGRHAGDEILNSIFLDKNVLYFDADFT